MRKPDVTIVVCTCNRAAMLPQAVKSLLQLQTDDRFSYEALIIDDGSTDDTAQVAAQLKAENPTAPLRYIYKPGGGVADARNFGVRHAAGDWVGFMDDDQIADPLWLAELMQASQEKNVACLGGSIKLLLPETNTLALGRKARRILGEYVIQTSRGRLDGTNLPSTGNTLIRKCIFTEIGGFDLQMREGGEDTEFFARLKKQGYGIRYVPQSFVWHVIPQARLTPAFLRWVSFRIGVATARWHLKIGSISGILLWLLSRLVLSLVRDLPLSLYARLTGNQALQMDCLCTLGYSTGYLRGCLYFLWPRFFRQQKFMRDLDFRGHGGERATES